MSINNRTLMVVCALLLVHSTFIISTSASTQNEVAEQQRKKKTPWWKTTYAKIAGGVTAAVGIIAMGYTLWNAQQSQGLPVDIIPTEAEELAGHVAARKKGLNIVKAEFAKDEKLKDVDFSQGIDTIQANGDTPLIVAMKALEKTEDRSLLQRLLFAGARIDIRNSDKLNALDYAVIYNNPKLFKLLLNIGMRKDTDRTIFKKALELAEEKTYVSKEIKDKLKTWVEAEDKSEFYDIQADFAKQGISVHFDKGIDQPQDLLDDTALDLAVRKYKKGDDLTLIKKLVKAGAHCDNALINSLRKGDYDLFVTLRAGKFNGDMNYEIVRAWESGNVGSNMDNRLYNKVKDIVDTYYIRNPGLRRK